jgi:hypothetical protein
MTWEKWRTSRNIGIKVSTGLESLLNTSFNFQKCYIQDEVSWATHVTAPMFSFIICKVRIVIISTVYGFWEEESNTWKALNTMSYKQQALTIQWTLDKCCYECHSLVCVVSSVPHIHKVEVKVMTLSKHCRQCVCRPHCALTGAYASIFSDWRIWMTFLTI